MSSYTDFMIDTNREAIEENYKKTLLTDTKTAMHLGSEAIPDAAFKYLLMRVNAISKDLAIVTFTVKDPNGNPVRHVEIQNLIGLDGANIYTDDSGIASGYGAVGNTTFSIQEYGDIEDISRTDTLIQGGEYQFEWTVSRRNYLRINASRSVRFTPDCPTISFSLCGGGGGGGGSRNNTSSFGAGGGGGGGGYSSIFENMSVTENTKYPVAIGNGGSGANDLTYQETTAYDGGTTTFLGKEAKGGKGVGVKVITVGSRDYEIQIGGIGNGNGGDGSYYSDSGGKYYERPSSQGNNGSDQFYKSYTELETVGGGGGGGYANQSTYNTSYISRGGSPNGGNAGKYSEYDDDAQFLAPANGKVPGGGGGGSGGTAHADGNRGAYGGAGAAAIRMHLTVAI